MRPALSLEKALAFTKYSVMLATVWPPDRNAGKFKTKFVDFIWLCSILSSLGLLIPLFISIPAYKDDPIIVSKSICLSCAVTQVIIKSIVCRIQRTKIQFLLEEMSNFFKVANHRERVLFETYVKKRSNFHMIVVSCCYGAAFFVICGPLFLPTSLPTEAKYPFSVNSSPAWELAYVHQSIVGFQASSGMCVDGLVALLLWFTGIRFELLYEKFQQVQTIADVQRCIREHQYLLRYGTELTTAFRYVLFATVFSVTAGLAFAGIYLFSPQPIFVKGQFIIVSVSAGINLYVTALPSDNLIFRCRQVTEAVYESLWIRDAGITKNWIMIIQRAQKPITIKIPGLLKELSLQYYFNVLSNTFSYFTALHVVLTKSINEANQ